MTEDDFRTIALSMPGAEESSHMNHPDFRAGPKRKIFATLNLDKDGVDFGVVMLRPEQQAEFVSESPDAFEPVNGKWGERGATRVKLKRAGKQLVRRAVQAAWQAVTAQKG
ncbi:MAG: MmcQ/YjbR family DNA-binding protein [Phycisphaerales bacterium]